MGEKSTDFGSSWVDPDDAPEWTEQMFTEAEVRAGEAVIRPGKWPGAGRQSRGEAAKR